MQVKALEALPPTVHSSSPFTHAFFLPGRFIPKVTQAWKTRDWYPPLVNGKAMPHRSEWAVQGWTGMQVFWSNLECAFGHRTLASLVLTQCRFGPKWTRNCKKWQILGVYISPAGILTVELAQENWITGIDK